MSILDLIVPKEKLFFEMLQQQLNLLDYSVNRLDKYVHKKNISSSDTTRLNNAIRKKNDQSDKISQEIIAMIYETFITPIDRDEIQNLTVEIDSVIDSVEKTTIKLIYLKDTSFDRSLKEISDLLKNSVNDLKEVFEKPMNAQSNRVLKINIKKNLRKVDSIFYSSMKKIFVSNDAVEILKKKELFETFRDISLGIGIVANTFERALINHS